MNFQEKNILLYKEVIQNIYICKTNNFNKKIIIQQLKKPKHSPNQKIKIHITKQNLKNYSTFLF